MQSGWEEGWRSRAALAEGRANRLGKPGAEGGSGASVKKQPPKKTPVQVQLANKMFQNVTGFKIWGNILTGFRSFASTKSK